MATLPNFTRIATAATVLTSVMNDIGLTPPADFLSSQDQTVTQLVSMLTTAGQDLCTMHDWQELHKEWEVVCLADVTEYSLPEDWNGFVNGASWNDSMKWPVVGSIPPAVWRMLKARQVDGDPATIMFKIQYDKLVLFSAQTAGQTMTFDYYSRGWLRDPTDPLVFRDNVQKDADIILLDSRIITALLVLRWRASKGFDTTAAVALFNELWDTVTGRDMPAPTLSIGTNPNAGLLGYQNIPDTAYGISS